MAELTAPASEAMPAINGEAEAGTNANPARIAEMLTAIAAIGADPSGIGISRVGFSQAERDAHALVSGWLRERGLSIRTDAIGNTIAERPGTDPSLPAIGFGSHLDSVPHGGRFDGIVGVVGAVELIHLLSESGRKTAHPLRVVIFAGEEGARFGEPCVGSKAVAGHLANRDLNLMRDAKGISLAEAMTAIGLDPNRIRETHWRPADWACFVELHIEQARALEEQGVPIGIVDIVSGSTRLRIDIAGRADHSGGTPMSMRSDALATAAEVVLAAEALAKEPQHRGARLTVGRLDNFPNSITTIPGRVVMTVDVRDVDSDRQRMLAAQVVQRLRSAAERRGVRYEVQVIADTSPAVIPIWIREAIARACDETGLEFRVMTSGAGHDSQVINQIIPAGMIFVPSKDGLSHVPEEWTSALDIARGVDVLQRTVLSLDSLLAQFGDTGGAS
ncbi:MAG TPA: Zn-dependent hydrolase [Candidatus Limnocylindria bacterium]|jgi:allantoate deiminase|nr:Zn-dependent hydrolase [Candidatus Limnocylindria bacterium]